MQLGTERVDGLARRIMLRLVAREEVRPMSLLGVIGLLEEPDEAQWRLLRRLVNRLHGSDKLWRSS